jgi:hypothetical protein
MTLTKEQYETRYPGGSYDLYLASQDTLARNRKAIEEFNAQFLAQAEENKARGFSND